MKQNVILIKGKCSICQGPIDEQWAGKDPCLGTKCRGCSYIKPEPQLFNAHNIDLEVKKEIHFDPLFGRWEYHFDWKGTKIMVNDQDGVILSTQADSAWVKFPTSENWGTPIKELGYWDLRRIYGEMGHSLDPDPMPFKPVVPTKQKLLDVSVIPMKFYRDEEGIQSITLEGNAAPVEVISMLHAFCNLYVRRKFGLSPNFACEGGFFGTNFEIRNSMSTYQPGIHVYSRGPRKHYPGSIGSFVEAMSILQNPDLQQDPSLIAADLDTVLAVWASTMLILSCLIGRNFV